MKFLLLAMMCSVCASVSAAETFLVVSGQLRAEIVIAERPARMAKLAARELRAYVEKISGAKLDIVTSPSPGKVRIYVGKRPATATLGLSTEGLEHGAFRMASGPDWLALLGPDEDFVPIEPWGRSRTAAETRRVNAEWDKIIGDTFWNNCRELYARYHKDLAVLL